MPSIATRADCEREEQGILNDPGGLRGAGVGLVIDGLDDRLLAVMRIDRKGNRAMVVRMQTMSISRPCHLSQCGALSLLDKVAIALLYPPIAAPFIMPSNLSMGESTIFA